MKNLINSELYRLLNSKKIKILFIITIIFFTLDAIFLRCMQVGLYDRVVKIPLDSLNLPIFMLTECHLFLLFIFCPVLFCESFTHERVCGAYRLFLIRPYDKKKFITCKIIACSIISFIFILILFIYGSILAHILEGAADSTKYVLDTTFTPLQAALYNLKFYLLEFTIMLSILGISSVIGLLVNNSAISYIALISTYIISIGINKNFFSYYLLNSKTLFDTLNGQNNLFLLIIALIFVTTSMLSTFIFEKRDYFN